jgi:hypothetical protein
MAWFFNFDGSYEIIDGRGVSNGRRGFAVRSRK